MKLSLIFLILVAVSQLSWADDIARGVRGGGETKGQETGGYFELGLGVAVSVDPFIDEDEEDGAHLELTGLIGGAYYYHGLFVELAAETADGINLGYTLWDQPSWSLDILFACLSGDLDFTDTELPNNNMTEQERDEFLLDRGHGFLGTGVRITGYFGNNIIQYRLLTDTYNDNGINSTLRFGHHWQYRNWNFHTIISAEYFSAKTANYFIGVSAEEATSRFPEYSLDETAFLFYEVGATYPLTEHWVLRSQFRYSPMPSEISDSPLIDETYALYSTVAISYAF